MKTEDDIKRLIDAVPYVVLLLLVFIICGFFDLLDREFLQQFITTVLGIALGLPAALYIERHMESKRDAQEHLELIKALTATLERNLNLCTYLEREMQNHPLWLPYYPMDLPILEQTAHKKFEIMKDYDIAQKIEAVRFELVEFDGKLTMMRSLYPAYRLRNNELLRFKNDEAWAFNRVIEEKEPYVMLALAVRKHLTTLLPQIVEAKTILAKELN